MCMGRSHPTPVRVSSGHVPPNTGLGPVNLSNIAKSAMSETASVTK